MNRQDPWTFLRINGQEEYGLTLLRETSGPDASASLITELGVAYLWVQKYEDAASHFQQAIRSYPRSVSAFYKMAGVAKLCLNDTAEAVRFWREGLNARFTDLAGGMDSALLLLVASILSPASIGRDEAESIIYARTKNTESDNWPSPLGRFALRFIDRLALETIVDRGSRRDAAGRRWLIEFYASVLQFAEMKGGASQLKRAMLSMSDVSKPEWSEEGSFLSLLWKPEFFIARHVGHDIQQ